jgi:hypothetical protein
MSFDRAEFEGPWLASVGRPELRGSWIIYGPSAMGKTTFTLMLLKYLATFDRCIYNSLEEGSSGALHSAWKRVGLAESGKNVLLCDREPVDELRARLKARRSQNIVFLDSLTAMPGFRRADYVSLMNDFPDKLFIFTAHEKRGLPDPSIAETVRRLSDVKIRVEGYKAFFNTRYMDAAAGEGGADYVIWPDGAEKYWAEKI